MTSREHKDEAAPDEGLEEAKQDNDAKAPDGRLRRIGRPKDVPSLALIKESTKRKYYAAYKDVYDPGALDRRTKELIAIGAAAISGCQGCLIGHIKKARALGVTMEQIKEAVAVGFTVNAATVVDHTDVVAAIMNLPKD